MFGTNTTPDPQPSGNPGDGHPASPAATPAATPVGARAPRPRRFGRPSIRYRGPLPRPALRPLPAMSRGQLGVSLAAWAAGSPRDEAAVALLMTAGGYWLGHTPLITAAAGIADHPRVHDRHMAHELGRRHNGQPAGPDCGCSSVVPVTLPDGVRQEGWTTAPLVRIDWDAAADYLSGEGVWHLSGGRNHHALLRAAVWLGCGEYTDPGEFTRVDPETLTRILNAVAHAAGWHTTGHTAPIDGHLDIQPHLQVTIPADVLARFWPPADIAPPSAAREHASTLLGQAARLLLTNWPSYAVLAGVGPDFPDDAGNDKATGGAGGAVGEQDPVVLDLVDDALDGIEAARLALSRLAEHTARYGTPDRPTGGPASRSTDPASPGRLDGRDDLDGGAR